MKTLIILLIALTGTFTAIAQPTRVAKPNSEADSTVKTVYTCTMHPEVISDKPGSCPKCGMKLVAKKVKIAKKKVLINGKMN